MAVSSRSTDGRHLIIQAVTQRAYACQHQQRWWYHTQPKG